METKDRLTEAFLSLYGLVSRLRGPGGCPWDAQQTDSTVKMYLIEEAYEVLDAIENGRPEDVREELGDLLFQILFLTSLARDRGEFDLIDVIEGIKAKMIKRHPHVFGGTSVSTPSEVSENWEKIKKEEKGLAGSPSSALSGVPAGLPALLRAHRLSDRVSKAGFDWAGREEVWAKVREEFEELSEALAKGDMEAVGEETGDLLFSLVNLARHWGLNAERIMRETNHKFINRFKEMEDELRSMGIDPDGATLEEMDRAWEKVKTKSG